MTALITVFTDAGFCHATKAASWAVWAKTQGQPTFRHSGVLRAPVAGSDVAEFRALVNGIVSVVLMMKPAPGTKLIVQSDHKGAVDAFNGVGYRSAKARRKVLREIDAMEEIIRRAALQTEFRHIEGHQGNTSARHSVNSWCDSECKKWLSHARKQHRGATA